MQLICIIFTIISRPFSGVLSGLTFHLLPVRNQLPFRWILASNYVVCVFFLFIFLSLKFNKCEQTLCRIVAVCSFKQGSGRWQTDLVCSASGCVMLHGQYSDCCTWLYRLTWVENRQRSSWSATSRLEKSSTAHGGDGSSNPCFCFTRLCSAAAASTVWHHITVWLSFLLFALLPENALGYRNRC